MYLSNIQIALVDLRNQITNFYNVVNMDDGRTWSTKWIVDDPKVFVTRKFW